MKLKQYLPSFAKLCFVKHYFPRVHACARGFTIIEMMVSTALGLLLLGMTVGTVIANRRLYFYDLGRTRLNQTLRSSLDIIGVNIREAGENLAATFSALEVVDGASGAPDELVLRRNLLDEVLKLCTQLDLGSTEQQVYFANTTGEPGCSYSDNLFNFGAWQTYRNDHDGEVQAFIFDSVGNVGEFFSYHDEEDGGNELSLERNGGTWQNTYPVGSSSIYILEEWHFTLDANQQLLELVENDDDANRMQVAYGLSNFQIQLTFSDGTVSSTVPLTYSWVDLRSVEVTLSGSERELKQVINSSITSRFFPRNVLSN